MAELEQMRDNLKEALLIKLNAHMQYIINNLYDKKDKEQVIITVNAIKGYIEDGYMSEPDQMWRNSYYVTQQKAHLKVLEMYTDIYNGMYKRYFGRSENFFLEKL